MQAVILAGGLGTRLNSVVPNCPKCLAPVAGTPFLKHVLEHLESESVRSVVLSCGYRAEDIRSTIGPRYRSIEIEYSREYSPLGTAGALRHARPLLRTDPIVVMNGDSYCAANLQSLIDFHTQRGAQATILVVEMPNIERFGCVRIDTTGAIIGFAEKSATSGPGWINAGVYVFSRSFLDELPDGAPLSLEYDVFPKWVCRGLYAHPTSEPFIDIGTPASYAIAQSFFARLIT